MEPIGEVGVGAALHRESGPETNMPAATWSHMISLTVSTQERATWRLAMNGRLDDDGEPIDHKTARSICDAIGERLQQSMRPDAVPPDRLQHLLDELRRRDLLRRP